MGSFSSNLRRFFKNDSQAVSKGPSIEALELCVKGEGLSAQGKNEEAIRCFEKAIHIDRNLELPITSKGVCLIKLGRHEEAIRCFHQALKIDPESAYAWVNLAAEEDKLGHMKEAVYAYEQFLLVDLEGFTKELMVQRVYVTVRLKTELGVDLVSDLYQIDCKAIKPLGPDEKPAHYEARVWNKKGTALLLLGKYENAVQCFDQALQLDPNSILAWRSKGNSLKLLGRPKDAIPCFDQTLVLDPRNITAWINKGESLNGLGHCEDAIFCYDQALIIDPGLVTGWLEKGKSEEKLGLVKDAIHSFQQVLTIAAEDRPNEIKEARARLQDLENR